MPYKTRYPIPHTLHSFAVVIIFILVIASPFYYTPFSQYLIKTINSQSGTNVAVILVAWAVISFFTAIGITDAICYILPLKKPDHEKH